MTTPMTRPRSRRKLTWKLVSGEPPRVQGRSSWPAPVTREWAFGGPAGRLGRGVRVCVVDSGVEGGHPLVGPLQGSYAITPGGGEVEPVDAEDGCGHGTACASVIRGLAPECELYSMRVLGNGMFGTAEALVTGLRWAVEQNFDVINMSLSTNRRPFAEVLHTLIDDAYFRRTVIVAAAHNLPVESFPWRFSACLSVGSHGESDPATVYYNPDPPVEFFARGVDVPVGWLGGGQTRCSGNSFAAPHVAGYCALAMAEHPGLTPFQVRDLLYLTASNVEGDQ